MEESEAQKKMEAQQTVFNIPEVVEILISFLDPASILHLAQSHAIKKETLKRSLSSKGWNTRIKQSSREEWSMELNTENARNLLKIFKLAELQEHLHDLSSFLLNVICENSRCYWSRPCHGPVSIICPCNSSPHRISPATFHLLEEVEAALPSGTTRLIVEEWDEAEAEEDSSDEGDTKEAESDEGDSNEEEEGEHGEEIKTPVWQNPITSFFKVINFILLPSRSSSLFGLLKAQNAQRNPNVWPPKAGAEEEEEQKLAGSLSFPLM